MDTRFCRGTHKYIMHVWVKGLDKPKCAFPGACMTTGHAVAASEGQQHDQVETSSKLTES
jgi:hypothetical protein